LCARVGEEERAELSEPVGRDFGAIPRVEPVTGDDSVRVLGGEFGDLRPIGGLSAVENAEGNGSVVCRGLVSVRVVEEHWLWGGVCVRLGEGADAGVDLSEAVSAGGGERLQEPECGQR